MTMLLALSAGTMLLALSAGGGEGPPEADESFSRAQCEEALLEALRLPCS